MGSADALKDLRDSYLKARPSNCLCLNHACIFLLFSENGYIRCAIFKFSRVDLEHSYHYPLLFLS